MVSIANLCLAQHEAAVHAVEVVCVIFVGEVAQRFGQGSVVVSVVFARNGSRYVAELQIVGCIIGVTFEDMYHAVVCGRCHKVADTCNRAVDDVAEIPVVVLPDTVRLAVFRGIFTVEVTIVIIPAVCPSEQQILPFVFMAGVGNIEFAVRTSA